MILVLGLVLILVGVIGLGDPMQHSLLYRLSITAFGAGCLCLGIVVAKDPTRGGLANTVNEFSEKSEVGILLHEDAIPIPNGVESACNMLGIDPLEIGNEGKVVLGVVKEKAEDVLAVLRKHPLGKHAAIIGQATNTVSRVVLQTTVGGKRFIRKPLGDPIPRIC